MPQVSVGNTPPDHLALQNTIRGRTKSCQSGVGATSEPLQHAAKPTLRIKRRIMGIAPHCYPPATSRLPVWCPVAVISTRPISATLPLFPYDAANTQTIVRGNANRIVRWRQSLLSWPAWSLRLCQQINNNFMSVNRWPCVSCVRRRLAFER